jgi:DNA modification methylase
MAVISQETTDQYAIYNGDSCEVLPTLPDESVHLSIYSPPFASEGAGCLYRYSSSTRDLSNCRSYDEFFEHYLFIIKEIERATLPGRFSVVHCMDIPRRGERGNIDLPGDIIRMHEENGWWFWGRHWVWKEPLAVRLRTMARGLAHKQVVDDSSLCDLASADCILLFRKKGDNPIKITHEIGLLEYAGEREIPEDLRSHRGWKGKQRDNIFSHWIWRQYASAFWDDIRIGRVLPYKETKEDGDERHMHPLQLDVIDRLVVLRSNPGETILTPFMGVGSEVYGAVSAGRRGIGIELKPSYYNQAKKNLESLVDSAKHVEQTLF